ncbi:MAG TPA: hypothetical protein VNS58_00570 [Puia sp.]|nr:hypothetical protein [Puia sp.]
MKNILLSFTFPLLLLGMLFLWSSDQGLLSKAARSAGAGRGVNRGHLSAPDERKNNILSCGPDSRETIGLNEQGKFIVPLSGWGQYSYPVSTSNDSTQFYFNQGLTMYYSYHMREAVASFKEAARFDSGCAMAYWGQALAMGPYYNAAYTYQMPQGVPAVLASMNRHNGNASAKEKKLIEVMVSRYPAEAASNSGTGSNTGAAGSKSPEANPSLANIGGASNLTYARGLKALVTQYPGDPDITALYIDAVMLMHAWDFWNNDGSAKEWTPELVDLCAAILKKIPGHPGGLHYYIHLTEASRHPEAAFPNAEALKRLFPGIAHMVHMSSHEYERTGLYAQGVEVNDKADDALGLYDAMASNLALNRHSSHYYAVETYCALSGAMYGKGMDAARHCRNSVAPTHEKTYEQSLYMLPALTLVRLGKWEELLLDSIAPDARWTYAGVLYHFARGLAFVYTGYPDSATRQLLLLRDQVKDPILTVRNIPFNTSLQGAGIAEGILNGALLFAHKKYDSALSSLKKAIAIEDGMIYQEPRDWVIPARHFLGAYLLRLNKPALAESIYRQDLVWHPGNGWSLLGLSQSLQAQHKDAGTYRADALRSFSQAEQLPVSSVFLE